MTQPQHIYQQIASLIDARTRCQRDAPSAAQGLDSNRALVWRRLFEQHLVQDIDALMKSAPSGSGIDNGARLAADESTPEKLVFHTSFHHMCEHGYYDGWTDHTVTVLPSFRFGFTITISGRNRNDIKDHLHDVFYTWLMTEVTY